MRWLASRAGTGPCIAGRENPRFAWLAPRASGDRDQMVPAAEEQDAVGEGGGGQAHLAQGIGGEQLELRPGADHADVAILAGEVEPAGGGDGRGREAGGPRPQALLVEAS